MNAVIWGMLSYAMPLCATMSFYAPVPEGARGPLPSMMNDEKVTRDAFGGMPNSQSSENFVIKWGNGGSYTASDIQAVLASLEDAWQAYIVEEGYPIPYGSEQFLFNVYIGNTGSGTPDSYGAAGYYTTDSDWYPMIVLDPQVIYDASYIDITVVHEFYHAIQDVNPQYYYDNGSVGAWYWESTAVWASGQVYPAHPYVASFLYSILAWLMITLLYSLT